MSKKKYLKWIKELRGALSGDDVRISLELIESEISKQIKGSGREGLVQLPAPAEIAGNEKAIAIYSDGACRGNPGPGAWGCLGQNEKGDVLFERSGFSEETTNNRMEMTGAVEALKETTFVLVERWADCKNSDVILYTDSKYIVDGMNSWLAGWKARGWKKADKKTPENVELWQSLDFYQDKFKSLTFKWVKGHAGHPQNERCDQLANICLDENGF